jgi:subtilisin family serine protease
VLAAAPGVNILAPVTGKGFDYLSGTSFAAAHVTGVIALIMERNPKLTAQDVRRILVDSAHDLGAAGQDADFGAGLTDAYGSLLLAGKR